jgi:ubiquinone/menaquinone biosynthesis C-methylase UbiE
MKKDLYTSGEYVGHFHPGSEKNPFREIYAEKLDYVIQRVAGEGLRILDLGGGMGRAAVPLSKKHLVTLADLSLAMLRKAGEGRNGFARLNCDAEVLSLRDKSFDAVLAIDLVSHLQAFAAALAEIRRVLKPGGLLLIDCTNRNPLWILNYPGYVNPFRQPIRWLRTFWGGGIPPEWQGQVVHLSRQGFARALEESGFRAIAWKSFGPAWCPKWHLAVCTTP